MEGGEGSGAVLEGGEGAGAVLEGGEGAWAALRVVRVQSWMELMGGQIKAQQ